MELDFSPVWAGWLQLLQGAVVTVQVTAASLLLGCVMGLLVGIGRLNPRNRVVYGLCTAYVAAIRGTPLLVQLFLLFFGLPQLGVLLPAFVCGVIGLGIYSGAYVSEIVRGAIQSIDRGQMEAARSIGLSSGQKIISVSYRSLEVYLAIAVVYFVLTGATTLVLRHMELRLRAGGMVQ